MAKKTNSEKTQYVAACASCGMLVNEKQEKTVNDKHYCVYCAPGIVEAQKTALIAPAPAINAPAGFLRFLSYIVCLFSPPIGFVLGTLYYSQDTPQSKQYGKNCFIFMGVGIIMWGIIFMLSAFFDLMLFGSKAASTLGFKLGEGYY